MDRPPNPRAPRLGPRAFSISLVNSFGGNFVWVAQLRKQTLLSPSTYGCYAEEAAVQIDMYEACFPPHSCHLMRSIVSVSYLSRICWPQFKAALAGTSKFAISPLVVLSASRAFEDLR